MARVHDIVQHTSQIEKVSYPHRRVRKLNNLKPVTVVILHYLSDLNRLRAFAEAGGEQIINQMN
jgi:hypothetical protein